MIGSGSAASANQLDPGSHKFSRVARHVFRGAEINIPPFNGARHAGVRLRGQRQGSDGPNSLDGVQHGDRPDTAVDAKHVDIPFRQPGGKSLRIRTVEAVAVFINRDLGNDGKLRIHIAAGEYRLVQLFDVAKGFQHQQIDAPFDQGRDLFAKCRPGLFKRSLPQRLNADTERADRSGHPYVETLGRFSGHVSTGQVDVTDAVRNAVARQAEAVRAESIGLDNLGARLQLVVAAVDEDAFGIEKRPHGSIAEDGEMLETFDKILRHLLENTRRGEVYASGGVERRK